MEVERRIAAFETLLDDTLHRHPGVAREILRKSILKAHRQWALKQEQKPPAIPPKA